MFRMTMLTLALALLAGPLAGEEAKPPADMARCDKLAAYYDRYAIMIDKPGLMSRHIGYGLCKEGKFTEGIADLEKAIRILGFTPPR